MDYIIYFAITIGILVFVHEFGHFAAAKLSGMRADVFAIGFGKRLFGYNKITGFTFGDLPKDFDGQGNTDYRLCLLPLGGYVKVAGMVDESFDTEFAKKEPQPWEFRSKPLPHKVFVIVAGVLMNLLLAWLVFWGANYFQGKQVTKTTTIGYVEPNSLADSLGFLPGERIVSINDKEPENWEEVRAEIFINRFGEDLIFKLEKDGQTRLLEVPRKRLPLDESESLLLIPSGVYAGVGEVIDDSPAQQSGLQAGDIILTAAGSQVFTREEAVNIFTSNPEKPLQLTILRSEDTLALSVTPGSDGRIGAYIGPAFTGEIEFKTFGFFESFYYGWKDIERMTALTFSMLGKVFTGKVEFGKAFGGPIRIAQFAAKSADSGIANFLYFLALLSLTLAIINIMPFPVLDGGHLIIILVEAAIKREIPVKVKIAIQNTGFVLLLLLMAFIVYNDILNL